MRWHTAVITYIRKFFISEHCCSTHRQTQFFYEYWLKFYKKSPANAKGNARQRCMCEDTVRTKS